MKKTIIAILLFLATQLVGSFAAMPFTHSDIQTIIWGLIISQVLMFVLVWAIKYFHPSDLVRISDKKTIPLSILVIVPALYALNMVNAALDLPNLMEDMFNEMSESVPALISIALFGPVIEEIVFRRVIIDDCIARFGKPWLAILISSVLFGVIHGNPAQMVFAFLVGLVFGWVYIRTGSMLPGLIGHIINNTVGVFEMRLAENGSFLPEDVKFYQDPLYILAFLVCAVVAVCSAMILKHRTEPVTSEGDGSSLQSVE